MTTKPPRTKPTPRPPKIAGERRVPKPKPARPSHWQKLLRSCGYPTTAVVLDFEAYFDDEISMRGDKLSTIEYILHPDGELLGVSVLEMQQPFEDHEAQTKFWSGEDGIDTVLAHLKRQYGDNLEGCTVVAQNAAYDMAILGYLYDIHPPHIIDILGLARHWDARNKNDLDSLAKRFGLKHKGDTKQFKGWTHRKRFKKPKSRKKGPKLPKQVPVMTDENVRTLADYANNDVMREWELFTLLLPKLSRPATELQVMQHTLDLWLKPCLVVDEGKAAELQEAMRAEIAKAVEPTGLEESEVRKGTWDEAMHQALEVAGDDADSYTKPAGNCKRGWKIASAKDDPQRELMEQHEDPDVAALMAAKAAVDSWPNHIKRIDRIVRMAKAAGGVLPVPLKYCGAHTGRWSGAEKINLQNLGSRGHDLVNAVRELLLAPEGYELVIADASQIEARVLAWIAGQWDLVEKFARGEEIYCGFASKVLGFPVRKPKKNGGIPAIEEKMKWARNGVGKVGILGCGYGMGDKKAVGYAKGAIDLETATKLVNTYREENDRIVQFWRDIEKAFLYTFRYHEPCSMPRGLDFHHTDDCDVIITLPCGRELKYHNVRVEQGRYGPSIRLYNAMEHKWSHIWGGHLTENVVQAMSRDILWEAMFKLEQAGHHIALHVHDELIGVVPVGTGEKVLDLAVKYLSERPTWGKDLPLDAEGVVAKRYGGH